MEHLLNDLKTIWDAVPEEDRGEEHDAAHQNLHGALERGRATELNGISSSFSWADYWTVEIGPVRDELKLDRLWRGTEAPPDAATHFVACEPEEAELWSVYGRRVDGNEAELIHDAETHEEALKVAAECMAAISEHGLPYPRND